MSDTPEKMYRISQTQLSIARYYGGCKFNGANYIYSPVDDTLTRQDVWKKEHVKKKKKSRHVTPHMFKKAKTLDISACCKAPVRVQPEHGKTRRGATYWFECEKCGQGCNLVNPEDLSEDR